MSRFFETLQSSLRIFLENPKFILPKLLISFLYSITILLTASVAADVLADPALSLLPMLLALLLAVLAVGVLDIVVSAMYPFLVKDALARRKVSIFSSLKQVASNAGKILPPLLILEAGVLAAIFILSIPLSILIVSESDYSLIFTGIYVLLILAAVFFFYTLYPLVAFEKLGALESFRRSIAISLKNKRDVAKATILSLLLSVLSLAIAFAIEYFPQDEGTALFWFAFIIIRFLTAYVYTYMYVLNPVFYLNYAGKK
ncbi:MAG TPA: hypothetical protein VJH23_00945 [archaeon]|nr:hypothetical protein [archaeon]